MDGAGRLKLAGQVTGMSMAMTETTWEASDESLALAARDGDREAFALLVERYRDIVFAYAVARLQSREEAEDAAQEAFVRAYQALPRFRPGGPWGGYLMRLARNLCHDMLRRRRVRRTVGEPADWPSPGATPEHAVLGEIERSRLVKAVRRLPEKLRVPLVMHYGAGRTYKEIALALGIAESTVVGRLAGALRLLRRHLVAEE
jgi:RNA polymerase sigma-70 factor (ECF subfamily)